MIDYFKHPDIKVFVDAIFKVRYVPPEQAALILAEAWDNSLAKYIKD
jgi:hypothetical protein